MAVIFYKLLLLSFCSNFYLMLGNHKITFHVAFTCFILSQSCESKMQAVSESSSLHEKLKALSSYLIKFTSYSTTQSQDWIACKTIQTFIGGEYSDHFPIAGSKS